MAKNEKTGKSAGSLASKGLRNPRSLTPAEIRKVCGSDLTQRADHKKPAKPTRK